MLTDTPNLSKIEYKSHVKTSLKFIIHKPHWIKLKKIIYNYSKIKKYYVNTLIYTIVLYFTNTKSRMVF